MSFFAVFYAAGKTMVYHDGTAKLVIARRVFDNAQDQFSLAQFGGVWLPLMSALELTTIWIDPMYEKGLSGSLISMVSFVALSVILFEFVKTLTGKVLGGLIASLVIMVGSLNLIYFGTSTMAEVLLMAVIAFCGLSLLKMEIELSKNPNHLRWLVFSFVSFALCCVTRYEGWFLTFFAIPVVVLILWTKNVRGHRLIAYTGTFATMPFFTMGCWLLYEYAIFGNPMYFAKSKYSAHEIDIQTFAIAGAMGSVSETVKMYISAVRHNFADFLMVIALCGMAVYLCRLVIRKERLVAPLFFGGIPVFYLLSLYRGQIAMQIDGASTYNLRYGLSFGLIIAIATGYLVATLVSSRYMIISRMGVLSVIVGTCILFASVLPSWQDSAEAGVFSDDGAQRPTGTQELADCLSDSYRGGSILLESWHAAAIQHLSGLPLQAFVTEASPDLWEAALKDPTTWVDWIYMGGHEGEETSARMAKNDEFGRAYKLVFSSDAGDLYLKTELAQGVECG